MSNDTNLHTMSRVFTLMLDETCIARNPVFHTAHPLTPGDFNNTEFSNNYVDSLNTIIKNLKLGFDPNETNNRLSKEQWLHSASQLMALIYEGIYKTFPLLSAKEYKAAFGPDKTNTARDFSFAIGAIHYFLMNTVVNAPHNFKQCA